MQERQRQEQQRQGECGEVWGAAEVPLQSVCGAGAGGCPDTVGFRHQESWELAGLGGKLGAGRPPGSSLWVPPDGALTPLIALQTESLLLQAERRALCACWPAGH